MLAVQAILLSVAASAFAYLVTVPNQSQGWNNVGNQTLSWQRVDTDPANFTVQLVNQGQSYSQILNALVDGTLGTTPVNPPSGGWPQGTGFRVNLVKNPNDVNTIYAQSSEFTINSTTSATGAATTLAPPPGTTNVAGSTETDLNPTSSIYTGSSPSGALPALRIPTALLSVIALFGFILA